MIAHTFKNPELVAGKRYAVEVHRGEHFAITYPDATAAEAYEHLLSEGQLTSLQLVGAEYHLETLEVGEDPRTWWGPGYITTDVKLSRVR